MDGPYFLTKRFPRRVSPQQSRQQRNTVRTTGFSLIEVLITLLLIALGLTGWALLLALGISTQNNAYARTQATLAAGTLMEHIRARRMTAVDTALADYLRPLSEQELNTCKTDSSDVNNDRVCWFQVLQQRLPRGTGRITIQGEQLRIEIFWYDGSARNDPQIDSREKCQDPAGANRVWSDNPIVNWVPAQAAPKPAVCLQVQRWTLAL